MIVELIHPSNIDVWASRTAGGVHEGLLLQITPDALLNITHTIHTVDASKKPANLLGCKEQVLNLL